MEKYKTCSKCSQTTPITNFVKDKSRKDGLYPRCKACCKEFRQVNQDKIVAYRRENREQARLYNQQWRLDNADLKRQLSAKWYQKNKSKIRQKWKSDYYANPEKFKISARKRRAIKQGVESQPYTLQDVINLWGTNCHICGFDIQMDKPRSSKFAGWENGLQLDHVIPLSKGGPDTLENVKPAHGLCNLQKKDRY